MGALAALANFTGEKDRWKQIVTRYNLKWSGKDDLGDLVGLLFSNRFDEMVGDGIASGRGRQICQPAKDKLGLLSEPRIRCTRTLSISQRVHSKHEKGVRQCN